MSQKGLFKRRHKRLKRRGKKREGREKKMSCTKKEKKEIGGEYYNKCIFFNHRTIEKTGSSNDTALMIAYAYGRRVGERSSMMGLRQNRDACKGNDAGHEVERMLYLRSLI